MKNVDLPIVPETGAANTASTGLVIEQKAADKPIKELGLGR